MAEQYANNTRKSQSANRIVLHLAYGHTDSARNHVTRRIRPSVSCPTARMSRYLSNCWASRIFPHAKSSVNSSRFLQQVSVELRAEKVDIMVECTLGALIWREWCWDEIELHHVTREEVRAVQLTTGRYTEVSRNGSAWRPTTSRRAGHRAVSRLASRPDPAELEALESRADSRLECIYSPIRFWIFDSIYSICTVKNEDFRSALLISVLSRVILLVPVKKTEEQ